MQELTKPEQEDRGRNDSLMELSRIWSQEALCPSAEREMAELLGTYAGQRDESPVTFHSRWAPFVRKTASLEATIPWLYLKGIVE